MKKKLIVTISLMLATIVLAVAFYQSDASQGEPELSVEEIEQIVTDQYPGKITDTAFDRNFNKAVYNVKIISGEKKYHLQLDGNTGKILKLQDKGSVNKNKTVLKNQEYTTKETHKSNEKQENKDGKKSVKQEEKKEVTKTKKESKTDSKQGTTVEQKQNKDPEPEQKTVINAQQAIDIALKEFPGQVESYELDEDDGRLIYEVEIESSKGEADFEIDAYTGIILVIDIELEDDDND